MRVRIQSVKAFIRPYIEVAGMMVRPFRSDIIRITLVSLVAGVVGTVGLVLIIPALSMQLGAAELLPGPLAAIPTKPPIPLLLFGTAVVLVLAGVQLRLHLNRGTLELMRRAAEHAARQGLLKIHRSEDLDLSRRDLKGLVGKLTGELSISCGFVMRQAASGLADVIQLTVILLTLFWLNAGLAIFLLLASMLALGFYARSVLKVASASDLKKTASRNKRPETVALTEILLRSDSETIELENKLDDIYRSGATGQALDQRTEMKTGIDVGPAWIESLFPVILVLVVGYLVASDPDQTRLVFWMICLLLLRQAIAHMQKIGTLFITSSRFHTPLSRYHGLMFLDRIPELSGKELQADDDEALV